MNVLSEEGHLEDQTDFGNQVLVYAIQKSGSVGLNVFFEGSRIELLIPESMIAELINTDRVGFEGASGNLHLLVEKDFTCLDNVAEDQSDNYPNPLSKKKDNE